VALISTLGLTRCTARLRVGRRLIEYARRNELPICAGTNDRDRFLSACSPNPTPLAPSNVRATSSGDPANCVALRLTSSATASSGAGN
jgi:hypothetical protein